MPGPQQRFRQRFKQGCQHHSFSKGSSSLIACPPKKSEKFRSCPHIGSSKVSSQTSNLTTRHIKQSKKQCKKKIETDTRIGSQQHVPARVSNNKVPVRFQQGFTTFQQGFIRFQQTSNAPITFQQGSKFHQVSPCSKKVLARFQQNFNDFPARFQQGLTSFQQVPAVCQQCSSNFRQKFQRHSSKVPVVFRFSRACTLLVPLPGPEIKTQQDRS